MLDDDYSKLDTTSVTVTKETKQEQLQRIWTEHKRTILITGASVIAGLLLFSACNRRQEQPRLQPQSAAPIQERVIERVPVPVPVDTGYDYGYNNTQPLPQPAIVPNRTKVIIINRQAKPDTKKQSGNKWAPKVIPSVPYAGLNPNKPIRPITRVSSKPTSVVTKTTTTTTTTVTSKPATVSKATTWSGSRGRTR